MNARYVHHAKSLAMESKIPVGLHFNLTEGNPISGKCAMIVNFVTGVLYSGQWGLCW